MGNWQINTPAPSLSVRTLLACSTLAPRLPQWTLALFAHRCNKLDDTSFISCASFPVHHPIPLPVIPGIPPQINSLHVHSCLRVCFWGNPDEDRDPCEESHGPDLGRPGTCRFLCSLWYVSLCVCLHVCLSPLTCDWPVLSLLF